MREKVSKHKFKWTVPTDQSPLKQTYKIWDGMIYRCTNPNSQRYYDYGGRGIKVCERWLHSFDNFVDDVGIKPEGLTLERLDVDGDYEPDNVKWATYLEQANNRREKKDVGVFYDNYGKHWTAELYIFGQRVYLGVAQTKEDALRLRRAGQRVKDRFIKLGVYRSENIDV